MKHYMLLGFPVVIMSCKCKSMDVYITIKAILYSFIDEDGNRYDGSTTLRVNGQNVLAINSPKVCVNASYNII